MDAPMINGELRINSVRGIADSIRDFAQLVALFGAAGRRAQQRGANKVYETSNSSAN